MNGFVIQMSPDRLIDPVTGFPYFSVKVEIPQKELDQLPKKLTLIGYELYPKTRHRRHAPRRPRGVGAG